MRSGCILTRALVLMGGNGDLNSKKCKDLYGCWTFLLEEFQQLASEKIDYDNEAIFLNLLCSLEQEYHAIPDVISVDYELMFKKSIEDIFEQIPEEYILYLNNIKSTINN